MKLKALVLVAAMLSAGLCYAKNPPAAGTIISQESVECGTKNHGKKSSTPILCHQYVVHTATTEYKIRQPKPSDSDIFLPNTPIQFTIDKSKMKFKVNDKGYEYLIVGTSALSAAGNK
jgi:hypothetical protein